MVLLGDKNQIQPLLLTPEMRIHVHITFIFTVSVSSTHSLKDDQSIGTPSIGPIPEVGTEASTEWIGRGRIST